MNAEQEQEYREEAERLKVLDVDQQRQVVELHRRRPQGDASRPPARRGAGNRARAAARLAARQLAC